MKVIFKNLEKSELARDAAIDRIDAVMDRFPDLAESRINITLSMENAPTQAGPDLFTVKVHCRGGRYKDLILKKSAPSLYLALAEVVEHLQERLNRFGDRARVRSIRMARQQTKKIKEELYLKPKLLATNDW